MWFGITEIGLIAVLMFKIMCAESSGKEIGFHKDGKSYGLFGLTEVACKEVGAEFPPASVKEEYEVATKYLLLMKERHDCDWLSAAGWYHGGDRERRDNYVYKLVGIKPDMFPEALEEWDKITGLKDEY